jgi:hypothetical protein
MTSLALGAAAFAFAQAPATVTAVPGMPPVPDARNLYSEVAVGKMSAAVADHCRASTFPMCAATTST